MCQKLKHWLDRQRRRNDSSSTQPTTERGVSRSAHSYSKLLSRLPTPTFSTSTFNYFRLPYKVPNKDRIIETPEQFSSWMGFQTKKRVGKGGFGVVNLVIKTYRDRTTGAMKKALTACKCIELKMDPKNASRSKRHFEDLKRELFVLQGLKGQCQYIIEYNEHYALSYGQTLKTFIYMEYADGGCLDQEVREKGRKMPTKQVQRYFWEMATGLEFIHRKGIAHNDFKLANVLLVRYRKRKHCKLTDFGMSQVAWEEDKGLILSGRPRGTPNFMAPEILECCRHPNNPKYDQFKADIWALGVSLYAMCIVEYPYEAPDSREDPNYDQILKQLSKGLMADIHRTKRKFHSDELIELHGGMLEFDAKRRFTIDAVMRNPWVEEGEHAS